MKPLRPTPRSRRGVTRPRGRTRDTGPIGRAVRPGRVARPLRPTRSAFRLARPAGRLGRRRSVLCGVLVPAAAIVLFLAGCSGGPRFRALDFEAAIARAKAQPAYSDSSNRDNSLVSFDVVTLGSLIPDPWSVKAALSNIEGNASGNPGELSGAVSLATWESARIYLGDTFERAYAAFVGSISYWMLGEDDNAAALWRNALDIDRESDAGYQTDFAVCDYLLARYYWKQPDQRDTAGIYLRRALDAFPHNPYLSPDHLESDNLVVLVEVGDGPRKIAGGPQGSILEWEPGPSRGGPVSISIDGTRPTHTAEILNLLIQAEHSMRPTGKKALQIIKGTAVAAGVGYGVYKLTKDPVLGIFAALALKLMPADTRQWWGVPAQVQLASFRLDPGTHTITLRTSVDRDYALAAQETVIPDVEVNDYRDTILLIRPVRDMPRRSALPPQDVPSTGIAANKNALAAPGSPIIDMESVDPVLRDRSPLYKYLPSREEIEPGSGLEPAAGGGDAPQP